MANKIYRDERGKFRSVRRLYDELGLEYYGDESDEDILNVLYNSSFEMPGYIKKLRTINYANWEKLRGEAMLLAQFSKYPTESFYSTIRFLAENTVMRQLWSLTLQAQIAGDSLRLISEVKAKKITMSKVQLEALKRAMSNAVKTVSDNYIIDLTEVELMIGDILNGLHYD